ncbi:MAG: hypothetical protein P4L85_16260 [Paludisphaera borealis]|uniref:hypothetical protein n=1 Tax=Paludisphaera borealis TaxID=1387353 RepID=UPI00283DB9A9|nr:hypothetical protein [Paludisphaera borealis]MDR3620907.1 hypothetical protein [Paludisphaera borealis]
MMRTSVDERGKAEDGPGRASSPRRIAIVLLILVASQIGVQAMTLAAEAPVARLAE